MVKHRRINKSNIWLCFLLITMLVLAVAGCGREPGQTSNISSTPATNEGQDGLGPVANTDIKKGFLFAYNDVEISIDMIAGPVLEALGKEQSYFEADSCAMEGKIRTYSYGSFELDTYELDGTEYISCIYFKDDMIFTKEGACLFMTQEDLFSIYGTTYTEEAGMLVYSKEGMKLKFIVTDGKVTSIQYTSLVTEVKQ